MWSPVIGLTLEVSNRLCCRCPCAESILMGASFMTGFSLFQMKYAPFTTLLYPYSSNVR